MQSRFSVKALPLLFVILFDSISVGFFFPLLNVLFIDPNLSILPAAASLHTRYLLYGHAVALYSVMTFIGAPFLGDLSDYLGRRKLLCFSLIVLFLSYVLLAVSVIVRSVPLLLISRAVAGFTAGNQSIAQAAVIDLSDHQNKSKNLAIIMFAASVGWTMGPVVGALLSDESLVHWFNFRMPFYFMVVLALINVLIIMFFFKETAVKRKKTLKLCWYRSIELIVLAFRRRATRELSIIAILILITNGIVLMMVSPLLMTRYHYNTTLLELFWVIFSLGYMVGFGYVVKKVGSFGQLKPLVVSMVIFAVIPTVAILVHHSWWCWGLFFLFGIANSVIWVRMLTLFSNAVTECEQGWVMGITDALISISFLLASYLGGALAGVSINLPFWLASAVTVVGVVYLLWCYRSNQVLFDHR